MPSWTGRRWLQNELPELVESGVVPPEVAARMREHYGAAEARPPVPLFAVLGATLIGLGIILLLAVNWEELSRPLRAGLCFALLLAAQGLAGWGLWRRSTSSAWCEAGALAVALASAAAIALIGQTYHVPGNLRSFLTSWLWLVVALPYLFESRAAGAVYLAGATGWLLASLSAQEPTRLYWLYAAAAAPFVWQLRAPAASRVRGGFLGWVAVPCFATGALLGFRVAEGNGLALLAGCIAAGTYALSLLRSDEELVYAMPARVLGALAVVGGLFALGYEDAWGFVGERSGDLARHATALDAVGATALALGLAGLALVGALRTWPGGGWPRALLALLPVTLAAGIAGAHFGETRVVGVALANLHLLALGVGLTTLGMNESNVRLANGGLVLLAVQILARFADWNLGLTLRGLTFIALGTGFLLLNLRLRRAARRSPA